MLEYLIRRILLVIPVVLGVSLLVFFLVHLIPGDPVVLILGESAQPADLERLRTELGLDQPLHFQLLGFFKGMVQFDLGNSLHRRVPVTRILMERFPATVALTLVSMIVAVLIALPLGIISALRARTVVDTGSMFFALLGVSMPNFWLGPLLLLLFYVKLDIAPPPGRAGWDSYVLPAITLGTALAAILTRMTRSSLLEVIHAQYVVTARAKGLSRARVILKHALRNALIPVVTILGLQFGSLLGGSIITETIFAWPGIGRELIQAIQGRDYPVVQGCVLLISFAYVLVNLLTDLTYGFLDPRIQYNTGGGQMIESISSGFRKIRLWMKGRSRMIAATAVTAAAILVVWLLGKSILEAMGRLAGWFFRSGDTSGDGTGGIMGGIVNILLLVIPPVLIWLWSRHGGKSWSRFKRNRAAIFGLCLTLSFILVAVCGPYLLPHDPGVQDLSMRLAGPTLNHPFGMDEMGRDLFSRVIQGARISIYVGFTVTVISSITGVLIGMIAGLAGGWLDETIMRIVDVLLAFPGILLAISLVAVLGPDINNVILALCLTGWVGFARLARGQVLAAREEDYVASARALGATPGRLIFRHLLPNITAPLIVQATLGMAGVIIAEAGLSFLGLGVQPPTPSWGTILDAGREFFHEGSHITVFPGIAIMMVVMGLNFLGDGLRDALDPKSDI